MPTPSRPRRATTVSATPPATPEPPPLSPAAAEASPDPGSHDRLLDAALREFAAHGFAGARVDRIAADAQINKAMLYYHFGSKLDLYRAAVHHVLARLVHRLEHVAQGEGSGPEKLDAFIDTFVAAGLGEPTLAPLMLREVAEGATHLSATTFATLARVAGSMVAIVEQGQRERVFRDVNPLLTYLTTAWPIMVYLSTGRLREEVGRHTGIDTAALDPPQFVRHMQDMSRRALSVAERTSSRRRGAVRSSRPGGRRP